MNSMHRGLTVGRTGVAARAQPGVPCWLGALLLLFAADMSRAEPDVVRLQYDWPAGMVLQAEVTLENRRESADGATTSALRGGYTLTTEAVDDGLRVRPGEPEVYREDLPAEPDSAVRLLLSRLTLLSPDYVVDELGALVRIEDFEPFRERAAAELGDWHRDRLPQQQAQLQRVLDHALFESRVRTRAEQAWKRDVGQWVGAGFERGVVYTMDFRVPVPMAANVPVPASGEYEFLGRVPCHDGRETRQCVRLRHAFAVERTATTAIISRIFETVGTPLPGDFGLTMDYQIEVITEERTLIPHFVKETRIMTLFPGREAVPVREVRFRRIVYTRKDPADSALPPPGAVTEH